MMTNEELKKKIAQIIADYFCPQGNEHKKLWGDDRLCYSKMNFAECEWVTECTDALIAAGIGDLKEHRIFAGKDGSIKQLYSGEEVEKIVKERKELKDELRSKVEYIHEQDEVIKEYKHRAQVAENELKLYKLAVKIWQERYSDIRCFNFNIALRQAEKELAEERKDEQS